MKKTLMIAFILLSFTMGTNFAEMNNLNTSGGVTNQYGKSLVGFQVFLECDGWNNGKMGQICSRIGWPETCIASICSACKENSSANLIADFEGQQQNKSISKWKKNDCISNSLFIFNTTDLDVRLKSGEQLLANIDLLAFGYKNKTVYRTCTSNAQGICHITDIPQDINGNLIEIYRDFRERRIVQLGKNQIIDWDFSIEPIVLKWNQTITEPIWSKMDWSMSNSTDSLNIRRDSLFGSWMWGVDRNNDWCLDYLSSDNDVPVDCYNPTSSGGDTFYGMLSNDSIFETDYHELLGKVLIIAGNLSVSPNDHILIRLYKGKTLTYEKQFYMNESRSICLIDYKECTDNVITKVIDTITKNIQDISTGNSETDNKDIVEPITNRCVGGCANGEYCSYSMPPKCCPLGTYSNGTECLPQEEKFQIFFVPINMEPTDPVFKNAIARYANFMKNEWDLSLTHFLIVNETLRINVCPVWDNLLPKIIEDHFKKWYIAATGHNSKAEADYTRYRVVGIDKNNVCNYDSRCGFAYWMFNNAVYLSGLECSYSYHVAAHEIGHTFGLCDDYDPEAWDRQNIMSGFGCPNERPNENNSVLVKCGADRFCYIGTQVSKDTFSAMGSGDILDYYNKPIIREFSQVCKDVIKNKIAEVETK